MITPKNRMDTLFEVLEIARRTKSVDEVIAAINAIVDREMREKLIK